MSLSLGFVNKLELSVCSVVHRVLQETELNLCDTNHRADGERRQLPSHTKVHTNSERLHVNQASKLEVTAKA